MSEWVIHAGKHIIVSHCRDCLVPGYMIISLRRPILRIAELNPMESTEIMAGLAFSERALNALLYPERIYVMRISELNPELHFHVFPRSANLARMYLAEHGDQVIDGSLLFSWARKKFHSTSPVQAQEVLEAQTLLKQYFDTHFSRS